MMKTERKLIYLITVLKEPSDRFPKEAQRSWAWYSDKAEALEDIRTNAGDMAECFYDYLVLEAVPEYQWPPPVGLDWFKWDRDENQWLACACPEKYANVIGFAIG